MTAEDTAFRDAAVLVTGAPGFIGRRLVAALAEVGARVTSLDMMPVAAEGVTSALVGDLTDPAFVAAAVASAAPEYVFHLAAAKVRSAETSAFRGAIDVNLIGTLNLLEAAEGLPRLRSAVLVGTAEEYGAAACPYEEGEREYPVSAYSFSKLAMTQLAETLNRLHGLPVTVVRPTVAYGPGQPPDLFVPALVEALVAGRRFPMTAGEQTRDFVYVDDIADALLRAAATPAAAGRVVNVGSGQPALIRDVALLVERLTGRDGLVELGAVPYRPGEVMRYCVDATLARDLLGWTAKVGLEEGLRRTIEAARL